MGCYLSSRDDTWCLFGTNSSAYLNTNKVPNFSLTLALTRTLCGPPGYRQKTPLSTATWARRKIPRKLVVPLADTPKGLRGVLGVQEVCRGLRGNVPVVRVHRLRDARASGAPLNPVTRVGSTVTCSLNSPFNPCPASLCLGLRSGGHRPPTPGVLPGQLLPRVQGRPKQILQSLLCFCYCRNFRENI